MFQINLPISCFPPISIDFFYSVSCCKFQWSNPHPLKEEGNSHHAWSYQMLNQKMFSAWMLLLLGNSMKKSTWMWKSNFIESIDNSVSLESLDTEEFIFVSFNFTKKDWADFLLIECEGLAKMKNLVFLGILFGILFWVSGFRIWKTRACDNHTPCHEIQRLQTCEKSHATHQVDVYWRAVIISLEHHSFLSFTIRCTNYN